MTRTPSRLAGSFIVMLTLLAPTTLVRAAGRIDDRGGFFSEEAIAQANAKVAQVQKEYGKDIVIETFATIPSEVAGTYSEANKDQFFHQLAQQRADAQHVNGVYVLINKQPAYLRAEVGRDTPRDAFSAADSQAMTDRMLPLMKQRRFDEALLGGVSFVQNRMSERASGLQGGPEASNTGTTDSRTTPVPTNTSSTPPQKHGWSMWTWLLIIGGIFLAVRFVRRMFASRTDVPMGQRPSYGPSNPSGQSPQYGAGGGGFGRGAMGGLLGGMAGGWLFDRMFRHGNSGGGTDAYGNTTSPPPSDDLTSTGSGGSFDDSSSSDSGGGDFGGGGGGGGGDDTGSGGSF